MQHPSNALAFAAVALAPDTDAGAWLSSIIERLRSAGIVIGGMNAGQGNVISSAVRQGVFASGFCNGSQVVKNSFPGTATPYNVSASRNLTIIN